MTDINRELVKDAAKYAKGDLLKRAYFNTGWLCFTTGRKFPDRANGDVQEGYIAARDAPE